MDFTERIRAWGVAHAQARGAEQAARQAGPVDTPHDLERQARSLREQADRLHREIYRSLDRPDRSR